MSFDPDDPRWRNAAQRVLDKHGATLSPGTRSNLEEAAAGPDTDWKARARERAATIEQLKHKLHEAEAMIALERGRSSEAMLLVIRSDAALRELREAVIGDRNARDMLGAASEAIEDGEVVSNMEDIADDNHAAMMRLSDALMNSDDLVNDAIDRFSARALDTLREEWDTNLMALLEGAKGDRDFWKKPPPDPDAIWQGLLFLRMGDAIREADAQGWERGMHDRDSILMPGDRLLGVGSVLALEKIADGALEDRKNYVRVSDENTQLKAQLIEARGGEYPRKCQTCEVVLYDAYPGQGGYRWCGSCTQRMIEEDRDKYLGALEDCCARISADGQIGQAGREDVVTIIRAALDKVAEDGHSFLADLRESIDRDTGNRVVQLTTQNSQLQATVWGLTEKLTDAREAVGKLWPRTDGGNAVIIPPERAALFHALQDLPGSEIVVRGRMKVLAELAQLARDKDVMFDGFCFGQDVAKWIERQVVELGKTLR